ncbi:replication protein P [Vibrio splendidus]|nr:replication protein P [Vibrio splendidus]MCC4880411.1 hypothetical protein [Vibrio splendidus]
MSTVVAPDAFITLLNDKQKISSSERNALPFTNEASQSLYVKLLSSGLSSEVLLSFSSSYVNSRPSNSINEDDMIVAARRFAYREPVTGIFKRFSSYFTTSFRMPTEADKRTELLRDWIDALYRENIAPKDVLSNLEVFLEKWNSSFVPTPKQFSDFCSELSIEANTAFFTFCERMFYRYKNLWNVTPEFKKFLYNDMSIHNVDEIDFEELEKEIALDSRFLDYPPNTNNIIVIAKYLKIKEVAVAPSLAFKAATNPKNTDYSHWMICEARRRVGSYELRVASHESHRVKAKFDGEYALVISDVISGDLIKTELPTTEEAFIPQGNPISSAAFFERLLNGK